MALVMIEAGVPRKDAEQRLTRAKGNVRRAIEGKVAESVTVSSCSEEVDATTAQRMKRSSEPRVGSLGTETGSAFPTCNKRNQ